MVTFLAALPVLTAVGLILGLRQSAVRAGVASFAVALALTISAAFPLPMERTLSAVATAAGLTLNLSLVVLGGLLLYRVLQAGGGLETLSRSVAAALPDVGIRVLTLVLGVSVFFESITGFGVGIVVCAPLFAALGLDARRSGLLALLGQCAVPWGALSIGTVLGAQLTGVPAERIAALGALLSVPQVTLCGGVALWMVGGAGLLRRHLVALLIASVTMLAVAAVGGYGVGIELAGVLAGLVVMGMGWVHQRVSIRSVSGDIDGESIDWKLWLPFALLIGALLVTRLVAPVTGFVTAHSVVTWPMGNLRLPLLYHPGSWLVVTAALAAWTLAVPLRTLRTAIGAALKQWGLATLSVAGFVGMAQVMFHAGMTGLLAEAMAQGTGSAYPLVLPFVAGLAGFLTASNAGANAMLAQLQQALAGRLHLAPDWIAAAQNAAAANATLASPGRVILAAIVTGEPGAEAKLLRPALAVVLAGTAAMALMLWWLV